MQLRLQAFLLAKLSRLLRHQLNHQPQNIVQARKRRRRLHLPHRLRLRRQPSIVAKKRRLQPQPRRPPRHLQLRQRQDALAQRHRQQRAQPHQRRLVNSTLAIYLNRKLLQQQPLPRPRAQPPREVRELRQQRRLRQAAATVSSGSIQSRMFTTRKARVFTARRKKANM